jgi:putative ABC transport system substrate-binding protein
MASASKAERGEARANTRLGRRTFIQRIAGVGAASVIAACGLELTRPQPSRTPRLWRIGYLSGNAPASALNYAGMFRDHLLELGYVEGRDFVIEFQIADSEMERLPAMAAALVARPVDVLIAEAANAQTAAKNATKTIPIVFTLAVDPVASGLVTNYARPGANITGVTTLSATLTGKRVAYLKEAVPSLTSVGIVWNANIANMRTTTLKATQDAARTLGVTADVFDVHNPAELDAAVASIAQRQLGGLVMLTGLSIVRDHAQAPDIASKYRLPQIFSDIEIVRAGGLMHFGSNYSTIYQTAAVLVDKILKGANPGDLPVEQPAKLDFIVNLRAAERIGLIIPPSILNQATEVIP